MKLEVEDLRTVRSLDDAERLRLRPCDFDVNFLVPTHDVHLSPSRISGRCGDMLVVQMKSGKHALENQQGCLRSLGLGRMRRASLRTSEDVTLGYLKAVRHLVGVVHLANVAYKEAAFEPFESQQFGTSTRPGQIARSMGGEYIGFRSDREELSVFMSTPHPFRAALAQLGMCGLEPELSSSASWISYQSGGEARSRRGHYAVVMDGLDALEIVRATIPVRTYGRATRDSVGAVITWQANVQRFHDLDRVSHEMGIFCGPSAMPLLKSLKAAFADPSIRAMPLLDVSVLSKGKRIGTAL